MVGTWLTKEPAHCISDTVRMIPNKANKDGWMKQGTQYPMSNYWPLAIPVPNISPILCAA